MVEHLMAREQQPGTVYIIWWHLWCIVLGAEFLSVQGIALQCVLLNVSCSKTSLDEYKPALWLPFCIETPFGCSCYCDPWIEDHALCIGHLLLYLFSLTVAARLYLYSIATQLWSYYGSSSVTVLVTTWDEGLGWAYPLISQNDINNPWWQALLLLDAFSGPTCGSP